MAGKSDQEKAAEDFFNQSASREKKLTDTINSRESTALTGVNDSFNEAKDYLNRSTKSQIQGMGLSLGDMLASQGIAPGADTASAWIANMSPIVAGGQKNLASLFGEKMNTEAGIRQNFSSQFIQSLLGNYQMTGNSIGGMKDSTAFGDVMSTILSGAQVGASIYGAGMKPPGVG